MAVNVHARTLALLCVLMACWASMACSSSTGRTGGKPTSPARVAVAEDTKAIVNPGFESGWDGWTDGEQRRGATALSGTAYAGERSVKIEDRSSFVSQVVAVEPNQTYQLSAFVRGAGNVGVKVGGQLFFEQQTEDSPEWTHLTVTFESGQVAEATVFCSAANGVARFDDFELRRVLEPAAAATSARILSSRAGGFGLSPDLPPGRNFDLLGWYLSTPADDDRDGKSDRITERQLAAGRVDSRYFLTGPDGGMVFRATVGGARTSKNTKYTRTELREMLRRGDEKVRTKNDDGTPNRNNWVFSTAPAGARAAAGGVDGTLRATLAVDYVTTTGSPGQVGRVIVGQIHAKDDEPARLYYRKLPTNERGAVYLAHEPAGRDDIYVELIGERGDAATDPADGIALGEQFSYEIAAVGHSLRVTVRRANRPDVVRVVDIRDSGYDVADDFMYFKAGVYNQNNTGDPEDYVQATFYSLEATHTSRPRE